MAERRMFARTVVMSDAFMKLPHSARCLYFALGMEADDDGFVNAPLRVVNYAGADEKDLNLLAERRYILTFKSGVIVIKHWRLNNYLRNDRHRQTVHQEELASLRVKSNGVYSECLPTGIPSGRQVVYQVVDNWYTEDSIGKDSNSFLGDREGNFIPEKSNKKEKQIKQTNKLNNNISREERPSLPAPAKNDFEQYRKKGIDVEHYVKVLERQRRKRDIDHPEDYVRNLIEKDIAAGKVRKKPCGIQGEKTYDVDEFVEWSNKMMYGGERDA